MGEGPNDAGTSRYHLLHQIDASLARLGLDHVDLYQIHGWDPNCGDGGGAARARGHRPLGPRALRRRVELGGVADRQGARHRRAARAGTSSSRSRRYYTVANRELERELVPMLRSEGPRADGVEPARRRAAVGQVRARRRTTRPRARAAAPSSISRASTRSSRSTCRGDAADGREPRRRGLGDRARLAAAPGRGLDA